MSPQHIDPALFRLRAFESDWLAPLLRATDSSLTRLLAAEAEQWITLGQRVGFFAQTPQRDATRGGRSPEFDRFFAPGEVEPSNFAGILSDAQDDLTSARREFLRLLLFAPEPEFERAVEGLFRLETAVAEPRGDFALAELVDTAEWALQGAESLIRTPSVHPAHWRSSNDALISVGGLRAARRLSAVSAWRARIAVAVGWKAVVDADQEPGGDREGVVEGGPRHAAEAQVPVAHGPSASVLALTLGIETLGGLVAPLIKRGEPLPIRKTETFSTAADNQTSVEVHVLLGERPAARDNRSLGRFHLTGIPTAPRGTPQIEVALSIDTNGTLKVSAKDLATSREQAITITDVGHLSRDDVARAIAESETHADEDRRAKEQIELRNSADTATYEAERVLEQFSHESTQPVHDALNAALQTLREAILSNNSVEIRDALDSLRRAQHDAVFQRLKRADDQRATKEDRERRAQPAEEEKELE